MFSSGLKEDAYLQNTLLEKPTQVNPTWDKIQNRQHYPLQLKVSSQSHLRWRRLRTKTQLCWIWSKDGNPWVKAPTAVTNYQLAASQLPLMNLLCFVSLAKYFLDQGQEAVPIICFISHIKRSAWNGRAAHPRWAAGEDHPSLWARQDNLLESYQMGQGPLLPEGFSQQVKASSQSGCWIRHTAREGNIYTVPINRAYLKELPASLVLSWINII